MTFKNMTAVKKMNTPDLHAYMCELEAALIDTHNAGQFQQAIKIEKQMEKVGVEWVGRDLSFLLNQSTR